MKTNDLIQQLTQKSKPVRRLSSPLKRFSIWFLSALLCIGAGLALMGLRHDLLAQLQNPLFIIETLVIIGISVLAAIGAFILSIPGFEQTSKLKCVPMVAMIGLFGLVVYKISLVIFGTVSLSMATYLWQMCIRNMLIFGLLPGIFLFFLVRQAAPLKQGWVGALAMVATAGLGAFALQFVCQNTDFLHILLWHFAPILVVGLIGIFVGKRLLHWK